MSGIVSSLTRRGRLFALLGIALLITGPGLGMTDLTRIGALLLLLPLLTLLIVRRHPLGFEVTRRLVPSQVQIEQPATVELTVANPSRVRSPVLAAEENIDLVLGDRPRWVIPPLRRGSAHTVAYEVSSPVRGRHRLGPLSLGVSDPFGLTDRLVTLRSSTEILVLPRVVSLGSGGAGARGVGSDGTIPHMVALHGEDDIAVRDYRDGDDLRRVHWPATARTGSLMVRQEDRPAMRRAVVIMDSRESVHGPTVSPSLEWAVTMAASIVAHCERLNYAVHLVTASPRPGIGRETNRLSTSLEALALVTPGPDEDLAGVLHTAGPVVGAGGLVIAILGACTDETAGAVASLRAPGGTGSAVIVDRTTMSTAPKTLRSGAGPHATAEVLRSAGWDATLVGPATAWAQAWAAITARPFGARVHS